MRVLWLGAACLGSMILLVSSAIGESGSRTEKSLSANEIVQKAVLRAQRADIKTGQAGYTYTKVTLTEEFDATGRVKEHKQKVYEVAFRGGLTHVKLVEVNGRAPAEADVKKQAENEAHVHQISGQAKPDKGGEQNLLTPEIVARFDFKLIGQTLLDGRTAYRIAFQPKTPEPPEHRIADRLLNRISGTVWIDTQEFEVARAEIQLSSEVNLLGGLIGSLKKLAYTVTRTRLGEGVWLNTFSTGDFEGRKLLEPTRIKTKSQSSNFRMLGLAY